MSRFVLMLLTITISITNRVYCLQENYYWREYTGTIPQDAVTGGKDINGKETYIGQAYLRNHGLMVAQISSGVTQVNVPFEGIKKVDTNVKILCGPRENFYWEPTNRNNLHLVLIDKHAVIGGHNDVSRAHLNIGRVSYQGETVVGKINSFENNPRFFFNYKGKERSNDSYEVLVYKNTDIDIRSKTTYDSK